MNRNKRRQEAAKVLLRERGLAPDGSRPAFGDKDVRMLAAKMGAEERAARRRENEILENQARDAAIGSVSFLEGDGD